MAHTNPGPRALRNLLEGTATIAMIGASSNTDRPSHDVMRFLLDRGFRVFPVNPNESEVLGQRAWPSLRAVPERVDVVDVFRRAEHTPAIADEAVSVGARALWLQRGIRNDDAARRAAAGGLVVVMDLCIAETVLRLGVGTSASGSER